MGRRKTQNIERYFAIISNGHRAIFRSVRWCRISLLFVAEHFKPKYCMISDVNKDLIKTYRAVRDNPRKLMRTLDRYKKKNSERLYYEIRKNFNAHRIKGLERAAAFIYLNKTCFNGLYRVNSKGEFNVPYGQNKNSKIYDPHIIQHASRLLRGVIIKEQNFGSILSYVRSGDFVYLDPCYDPVKPNKSFVQYTPSIFKEKDRVALYRFVIALKKRRVSFVLSNSDLREIRRLYKQFKIKTIVSDRIISGEVRNRIPVSELVISYLSK